MRYDFWHIPSKTLIASFSNDDRAVADFVRDVVVNDELDEFLVSLYTGSNERSFLCYVVGTCLRGIVVEGDPCADPEDDH